MALTEGRVAMPERQWGCRRGTPDNHRKEHTDKQRSTISTYP